MVALNGEQKAAPMEEELEQLVERDQIIGAHRPITVALVIALFDAIRLQSNIGLHAN